MAERASEARLSAACLSSIRVHSPSPKFIVHVEQGGNQRAHRLCSSAAHRPAEQAHHAQWHELGRRQLGARCASSRRELNH